MPACSGYTHTADTANISITRGKSDSSPWSEWSRAWTNQHLLFAEQTTVGLLFSDTCTVSQVYKSPQRTFCLDALKITRKNNQLTNQPGQTYSIGQWKIPTSLSSCWISTRNGCPSRGRSFFMAQTMISIWSWLCSRPAGRRFDASSASTTTCSASVSSTLLRSLGPLSEMDKQVLLPFSTMGKKIIKGEKKKDVSSVVALLFDEKFLLEVTWPKTTRGKKKSKPIYYEEAQYRASPCVF